MCVCCCWILKWRGKALASEVNQVCLNGRWGNLRSRRQPNPKGRGHTTHQPASGPTFLIRCQLVRNSFRPSLSHFPRCRAEVWDLNINPLLFYAPFFSLCRFYLQLRWAAATTMGLSVYLSTSMATLAPVKGHRTEVVGTPLCLSFSTLPWTCYWFIFYPNSSLPSHLYLFIPSLLPPLVYPLSIYCVLSGSFLSFLHYNLSVQRGVEMCKGRLAVGPLFSNRPTLETCLHLNGWML